MARTTRRIIQCKEQGQPIVVLTASDFLFAQMLDQGGVDIILVGDSLGMVALGYDTTLPVTLEDIIHHAKAVCRGRGKLSGGGRFAVSELSGQC